MDDPAQHVRARSAQAHDVYQNGFETHGATIQALGWSGTRSQRDRFEILADVADLRGASVLDVGCGFGDLHAFLVERFGPIRYTGLEPVPEFVRAARDRLDGVEIIEGNLDSLDPSRRWDYVFESGILNIGCYDFDAAEHCVRRMYARARVAVAANFLSRHSTGAYNETAAYFDPADLVTLAAKLTRRFSLWHHYRNNDFTLCLWRHDEAPGTEAEPGAITEPGVRHPVREPRRQ